MPSTQMSSTRFLSDSNLSNPLTLKKTQMTPNSASSSSSESHSEDSISVSLVRKKLESNSIQPNKGSKQLLDSNKSLTSKESDSDTKSSLCEISSDDRKSVLDMVSRFSNSTISAPSEKDGKDMSKQSTLSAKEGSNLTIADAKPKSVHKKLKTETDNNKVTSQVVSKKSNVVNLDERNSEIKETPKVLSVIKSLEQTSKTELEVSITASSDGPKRFSAIKDIDKTKKTHLDATDSGHTDTLNSTISETPKVLSVIKNIEQTSKTGLQVSKTVSSGGPKKISAVKDTNKTKKTQLTATDSVQKDTSDSVSSDAHRVLSAILNIEKSKTSSASSDQPKRPISISSIEKTVKTSLTVHKAAKPDGPKQLNAIKDIKITSNTALALQNSSNTEGLKRLSAINDKDKTAKAPLAVSEATSSDVPRSSIIYTEQNTKTQLDEANSTSENTLSVLSVIKSIEAGQNDNTQNVKPKIKSYTLPTSNSNYVNSPPKITLKDLSTKSNSDLGSHPVSEASTLKQNQTKETKEIMSSKADTTQAKDDASTHTVKTSSEKKDGAISNQNPNDDIIYEILPSYETYEILPSPETAISPIHLYNNLPSLAPIATFNNYINYNPNLEKGCVIVLLFDHEDTELVRICIKDNVHRLKEAGGQLLAFNSQFCLLPERDTAALFIYFTNAELAQTWLQHVQTHDLWLTNLCCVMVGENLQNRGRPAPLSEYKSLSVTLMKRRRTGSDVNDSDLEQFRVMSAEVVAPMKEKHGGRTLVSARTVTFISGNWSSLDVNGEDLSFVVTQWPNLESFKKYRRSFNANEDLTRFYDLHEKLFSKVLTSEFDVGEVDSFQRD